MPDILIEAACIVGAMLGSYLRIQAYKQDNDKITKKTEKSLFLFASAAGLCVGLIGGGIHLETSFLAGLCIVIGYAGGRHFFDLAASAAKEAGKSGVEGIKKNGINKAVDHLKSIVGKISKDTDKSEGTDDETDGKNKEN